MTEPKLTEAERETLANAAVAVNGYFPDDLFAAVEAILAARLAPLLGANDDLREVIDEARANRDRLAHENAALRQQVADLTAAHREDQ